MNADQWLNECLLIEGGKQVKRKDVLNLSIPRERLIKELFHEIQRTVIFTIPTPIEGENVDRYHFRVCRAARKSGGTVITKVR